MFISLMLHPLLYSKQLMSQEFSHALSLLQPSIQVCDINGLNIQYAKMFGLMTIEYLEGGLV